MSVRSTLADAARRALVLCARGTLTKADDKHLFQECDIQILKDEKKPAVERFQDYGFSGYPKKPSQKQQGGSGGGGGRAGDGGGGGEDGDKLAEMIVEFLGSERTHAVITRLDDRRFRLWGLKEGETVFYDDQQQKVHITRTGIYTRTPFTTFSTIIKDEPKKDAFGKNEPDDKGKPSRDQSLEKDDNKPKHLSFIYKDKNEIIIKRQDEDGNMLSHDHLEDKKNTTETPSLHIVLDETKDSSGKQKKKITISTDSTNTVVLDEIKKTITIQNGTNVILFKLPNEDDNNEGIFHTTSETGVIQDQKNKQVLARADPDGTKAAVLIDGLGQMVYVGDITADRPASCRGTIDTNGYEDIDNFAKKVLVK